ncbi:MAG: metalloprotease [Actinobacteria bacterium]|nr:metalloprotease [Actinomycetota bacterium]
MRSRTMLAMLACLAVLSMGLPAGTAATNTKAAAKKDAVSVAKGYVSQHRRELRLKPADIADLAVTDTYRSAASGVTHVYLRQRYAGIDVLGAGMTVNVKDGRVIYAPSRFIGRIDRKVSGIPTLTPVTAVGDALKGLGLSASDVLTPATATLVYQPVSARSIRLAWNLEIQELSGQHWWNVSVDAQNGSMLARYDLVDHDRAEDIAGAISRPSARNATALDAPTPEETVDDGSSYLVYALPFESPQDGERTLQASPADAASSPFGWHDTDGVAGAEYTTTRGNNVHAYADYTPGVNRPLPTMDAEGGEGLDFEFEIDFAMPPPLWRDAAITNLFYWNNIAHDVFYNYGFDEAAGNFQAMNYLTGEGLGADAVQAEAHDGSGVDNANFATPADGSNPRMQMYLWATPKPGTLIDGDLDSGVILHEWAHGISNRLTGGPTVTGCLSHQEREGEGWSDWLALAVTTLPGETGDARRGMGTYVLGEGARTGDGIRPTPYSNNMAINPSTYNTIKTSAVPHGVGYVWATMLWEVYWDLIEVYGFNPNVYEDWTTGGNNLALQLVMDGMKMQPCKPGFVDSRDAILAADLALTGGVNQCLIWTGFAKRGLGVNADQGSVDSATDGIQDFDVPASCI